MNFNQITEQEYEKFLDEIQSLMKKQPSKGTRDTERLKLISLAVQNYEKQKYFFDMPTPVEAIKFRMDEMGLDQKDLIPYLGGKNRVSEILSQKRPLTLPMVKALHKYLGIPLEVLLPPESEYQVTFAQNKLVFDEKVVREISKKKWIDVDSKKLNSTSPEKLISNFLKPIGGLSEANVLFRNSPQANVKGFHHAAAFLWTSKVLIEGDKIEAPVFDYSKVDTSFLKRVASLSFFKEGPLLAKEELLKHGVKLVIVPHLSSTYIDGGTVVDSTGNPVIGLSLRYDRLDNFWHTLMHELVHVYKHLKFIKGPFLDDTDADSSNDPVEKEADQIARDIFIPKKIWRSSDVLHLRTEVSILELARELHIHPAIIAGRIRFETKKYNLFTEMLKIGSLRKMFGC